MCGIAGWLDYARDLTRERETALAMTREMAKRGPDAEGLWMSTHAALGHRRLSVIDLEGGRQPMVAGDGTGPEAVITYSGEVYNFEELRADLRSRGHRFATRSDTEVVLRSYLEWGEDFVTRLNGIYAFAIWDTRTEELLLVRDRMGVKPLYYSPTASGVLFGSEPKAILANPQFDPVVDVDGLRDLLSIAKNPGRAVFREMAEVPPGCLVRVSRDGTVLRRYWALEVREHTDGLDATVRHIRELLEDIVARQLVADVPLCTLLSGPDGNQDHVFARYLAEHVGSRHSETPLRTTELLDPALKSAVLAAYDLPIAKGDEHASLYLLFEAIRGHSTVALSGECGDEVFGGYRWHRNPAAVGSGTFPWVHSGRHRYQGAEILFDPDLMAKLDLRQYELDSHRDAVAEIKAGARIADPVEARFREVTYLGLTRHAQVLFDRKDRMSMAHGLEVRVPFADHRLVEYTFNVPWSMKNFDGREKSLLRAASRDLLPESVSQRVKTPYPSIRDDAYDRILHERMADVLRDETAPIAPLLDDELRRSVRQRGSLVVDGTLSRASLETALQVNSWLAGYRVRVAV
ncbi:MAG: asparagine synthase (glutamine-hydrolyzing) [Actinobacteria bacterium 13_2_20CM_2_71_6]|nr:MAG: asparagine synthase (glutamine-hydrolyzing) [Actinobacteria bacterium 13_2_20CM_2_71_6]